jgi:AcrR family transcriptional regulator
MGKRAYNQSKRGDAADATRRKIVEATFALHAEQGIAATTMKQIAARAGVSVGSVYHHFPTYDDAIQACGGLVLEKAPPLDASIFADAKTAAARVAMLVSAQFAQYARLPILEVARADRHTSPMLEAFLAEEARHRKELAAEALAPLGAPAGATAMLAALVDIGVWRALTDVGFDTAGSADLITNLVCASLESGAPDVAFNPSAIGAV